MRAGNSQPDDVREQNVLFFVEVSLDLQAQAEKRPAEWQNKPTDCVFLFCQDPVKNFFNARHLAAEERVVAAYDVDDKFLKWRSLPIAPSFRNG